MRINEILKNIDEKNSYNYEDDVCPVCCGLKSEDCDLCNLDEDFEEFDPNEIL